uniref:c-type cytochrome n=1 Tax=uncultured Thiothrix sp. TaxID=223185 RepID=UPI00260C967A
MASIPKDPYAKPVLIGGLVILGTAVAVLVSNLFSTIHRNSTVGANDTSMFEAAAAANLQPIGTVVTVDKSIAPVARTGEQVFNAVCTSCHTAGVLNAPKIDDKAAWEPRVAKGLQGLLGSATNGFNQMPAKGGDPSLTEQELTDAILYMTGKAGFDLGKGASAGGAAAPAAAAPAAAAPAAAAPAAAA